MMPGARSQEPGAGSRARALAVLAASFALLTGCGKPPKGVQDAKDPEAVKGKPWETAGKRLRRDTDAAATKAALNGLNGDLLTTPDAPKPDGLSKEAEAALAALVPLNPDDLAELRPATFTPHDPAYLAECLYLRDVARTLEVPPKPGQTPEQAAADRADLAFAWVCRQVYVNPWIYQTPGGLVTAALPPTYVLRRGHGSGLERMYVFLALLQQMNLDGCVVGPPDAKDKPAPTPVYSPDKKTLLTGAARGPFWAAGVRVGNDVRLYDPWRGQPFPAPLSALKANPDAHKAWFEDKANAAGTTVEDAKQAAVFLAVPVNSLAPRMKTLEEQLKSDLGAELAVDAAALRNAFLDPKPAFWNPTNDRFAYGRTARLFLPADDGGADRGERGTRLYDLYGRSQIPEEVLALPADLQDIPEATERVRLMMAGPYYAAFFNPPSPREKFQRGQFQDASRDLVSRQDQYSQGLERLRNTGNAEDAVRKWAAEARRLYDQLGLARTPDERQAAAAAVENHWQQKGGAVQLLIDRVSAEVGLAEAMFLLALCKHEQAEQVQSRFEHASGSDAEKLKPEAAAAWETAHGFWQTYADRAVAQAGFPGRAAHVKLLSDRAAAFATKK